jgi:hypothetical protein
MQPELELGDHAEVTAATAQRPVQVGMGVPAGPDHLAIGRHDLKRDHVIAGQPVLPSQPAHSAAERQAADAGVRDVARHGRQAVSLRRAVEGAEQSAALHPGSPPHRVDPYPAHRAEVDHHALVGHGELERAVAAAADPDLQVEVAGRTHRGHHVRDAGAADDHRRPPVHQRVPDRARVVVPGVAGQEQLAVQCGTDPDAGRS